MLFSVVTPSLNQGEFIADCLRSVASQNGGTLTAEHIVVDACSTDGTVGILRETPGIIWSSEPDRGQTDAINKGLGKARGEWLMWLNADDYLLPDALRRVADYVSQHPELDVVYGDCLFVDESGGVIREKKEGGFSFWKLLFYGCYIPSTATFFKRSIIQRGLLLDPAFKVCMDFDYFVRLALGGARFGHLPELLAAFRWHGSNISTTFAERRRQERLLVQRTALASKGLNALGNTPFLWCAFQFYRMTRTIRRALGRRP